MAKVTLPPAAGRADRHQQQYSRAGNVQQEAATNFIQTVLRPDVDKGIVVSFDASAVADMTDDIANS